MAQMSHLSPPVLAANAAELFQVCDHEEKGFVTKRDMQRMRREFPLEPEQLETVFDTLDIDKNGYLTLEEFTEGFAKFLGIDATIDEPDEVREVDTKIVATESFDDQEDEQFEMLLDELGVRSVIGSDDQALKAMWNTLKLDPNPEMMANFEEVLSKLTGDVQKKSAEQETLESTIRSRSKNQEEQMTKLYEEMEQQMEREREEIRAEEERKEKKIQKEFESMLQMKDAQMQNLLDEKRRLKEQLEKVSCAVPEMREEKDQLLKERDKLERDLALQRHMARELQDQMDALRHQTDAERKERAKAAFRVSENIAQEREGIVSQLDKLRMINTKIIDENDSRMSNGISRDNRLGLPQPLGLDRNLFSDCEVDNDDDVFAVEESQNDVQFLAALGQHPIPQPRRNPALIGKKPASVESVSLLDEIAETLEPTESVQFPTWLQLPSRVSEVVSSDQQEDLSSFEDYETRPQYIPRRVRSYPLKRSRSKRKPEPPLAYSSSLIIYTSRRDDTTTEDSDAASLATSISHQDYERQHGLLRGKPVVHDNDVSNSYSHEGNGYPKLGKLHRDAFSSSGYVSHDHEHPQLTPDPATLADHPVSEERARKAHQLFIAQNPPSPDSLLYQPVRQPERIFKVIFIGDSSVGKTSLITRFCKGQFRSDGTASTVGINFQTRTLLIDTTSVCLQCWDTAGQERYRAMTRQFFRKSDAAVVVYDVTNEGSFLNARQWLDSAKDAIQIPDETGSSQAEFLLLGNKADLADDDINRKVRKADGLKLARAYTTLFGEVSAADGRNVEQSLTGLAKLLAERQDYNIQKTIKLSKEANQKNKCC